MSRPKFGIRTLLWLTFIVASMAAFVVRDGSWITNLLLVILLANFAGAVVALFVTFVFGFPRNGGLRTRDVDAEIADSDSPTPRP